MTGRRAKVKRKHLKQLNFGSLFSGADTCDCEWARLNLLRVPSLICMWRRRYLLSICFFLVPSVSFTFAWPNNAWKNETKRKIDIEFYFRFPPWLPSYGRGVGICECKKNNLEGCEKNEKLTWTTFSTCPWCMVYCWWVPSMWEDLFASKSKFQ
jgi:hypothetical protein